MGLNILSALQGMSAIWDARYWVVSLHCVILGTWIWSNIIGPKILSYNTFKYLLIRFTWYTSLEWILSILLSIFSEQQLNRNYEVSKSKMSLATTKWRLTKKVTKSDMGEGMQPKRWYRALNFFFVCVQFFCSSVFVPFVSRGSDNMAETTINKDPKGCLCLWGSYNITVKTS